MMSGLHHPHAVRRAFRTSSLAWFLFLLPATLAVFGPAAASAAVSVGLLVIAVSLWREPGRWWESTRVGVDLLTLVLSLGLGTAILVPAQWGFLGEGATRLLWILGALVGLLVLMYRTSQIIQDAFWPDTVAASRRRWFHRACLGVSALAMVTVAAAYVSLAAPSLLSASLLATLAPITGALAILPPLAFPLVGLIILDADATLAIKRWSLQADEDDEQDAFGLRRKVWPARRLAAALKGLQEQHALTRSRSPEGWMLAGEVDGLPLRVHIEQERLPPRIVLEADVSGIPPGLWIQKRDGAHGCVLTDPVLRASVSAGGAPAEDIDQLLTGLHEDVLSVIAAHKQAAVQSGRVRVVLMWEDSAEGSQHWLQERIGDVIALGKALRRRSVRLRRKTQHAAAASPAQHTGAR